MSSEREPAEAYVWVWLRGATTPVVAGRVRRDRERLLFNYGRSYLDRPDAIPLYLPELPLQRGLIVPPGGLAMAGCLRDAAPDAWGRRVILHRRLGRHAAGTDPGTVNELSYLLESVSDRPGALDFQRSPTEYHAREGGTATLDMLIDAAALVESGTPLPPALAAALQHGTSLGGARPKAAIEDSSHKYIAKFSSSSDTFNVVKAEFVAMRLAARVGLDVAQVTLTRSMGRDVLLVERFDRTCTPAGWQRHAMVSALTLQGLDEMMARYASYETLAEIVRHRFANPAATLRELFARLTFNVLCGNTDDHARNHAAFWDGAKLRLTPAYDICPQARTGGEASQAMLIRGQARLSRVALCVEGATAFLLQPAQATAIVRDQIARIRQHWNATCDEAALSPVDRAFLWQRQFLNPFGFEGAPDEVQAALGDGRPRS